MNDQERISPYNIMQLSIENKEKYQLGDYQLIHHQIPWNKNCMAISEDNY